MSRLDEIRKKLGKGLRPWAEMVELLAWAEAYRKAFAVDMNTDDCRPPMTIEECLEAVDAEAKRIVEERKNA